ncbi:MULTISPECIES: phage major tail tube protein [Salinicola]|uniref:Phage major tail tube protein n=1 Tax=Salinicola endophyticus TaxID=1949083 RepID=A0AB74UE43_9GAMM|nr:MULTISPECIES: phage major tail tube protein [unclassified Salinicola]KFF48790.1 major tail tube protein [Gammaproteobacteria bacterium MFB021]MCE3028577.1 phage major tail tube protein [Salinicola sp. DM10]WIX33320.1 phage major tail tube protein [Salinicola sp. JS01]
MALPKKLKALNLFGNGDSYQGQIQSVTLPTLTRKIEEWRGGGMDGSVGIDMGMDGLMTCQWTVGGLVESIFDNFGASRLDADLLRMTGSYERDDTDEVVAVEVVMRGRHTEIDFGDAQDGENTEHKITSTLSYYKLVIGGVTKIEIDLPNYVFKVNGDDRLARRRQALGI